MGELLTSSDQDVNGVVIIQYTSSLFWVMPLHEEGLAFCTTCAEAERHVSDITSMQVKCQEGLSVLWPGQKQTEQNHSNGADLWIS